MKPAPLALTRRGAEPKAAPISLRWSPPTGRSLPVLGDTETRSMQPHRAALLLLACLLAIQECAAPAARAVGACQLEKRQAGGGRPAGLLQGRARTLPTFGAAAAGCDGVPFLPLPACSAAPELRILSARNPPRGGLTACPNPVQCFAAPCAVRSDPCPPGTTCVNDYCGGCSSFCVVSPAIESP